ncbi:hypothetical protein SEVIR_1G017166v4 [Setaria viridis]
MPRAHRRCGGLGAPVISSFACECAANAEGGGKPGGNALCAVCLEGLQRGEAVRRLPACGHHHKECVDMWLRTHTTCPLCRCDLLPLACASKTVTAAARVLGDVLPPV